MCARSITARNHWQHLGSVGVSSPASYLECFYVFPVSSFFLVSMAPSQFVRFFVGTRGLAYSASSLVYQEVLLRKKLNEIQGPARGLCYRVSRPS